MTHRAECGGMRFWFQMGWVPCIQSRSCRLQCYNPGSFKPSGRSNSHLSTRQSICASRGRCSLGSLASTLVLGFWAFQLTKKPFDPTVSEVHGGIDNVPVSLLLRMYNISQVSNLVSSCPGCKTQQDWHAPAIVQLSLLRCVLAVTMTTREADHGYVCSNMLRRWARPSGICPLTSLKQLWQLQKLAPRHDGPSPPAAGSGKSLGVAIFFWCFFSELLSFAVP